MKSWRYSLPGATLAAVVAFSLLAGACQAPFFQTGQASALKLELGGLAASLLSAGDAAAAPGSAAGSRFLTPNAASVKITIASAQTGGTTYYTGTTPVSHSSDGKPMVTVSASGIPLDKSLWVAAEVLDATGATVLTAGKQLSFAASGSASQRLALVPAADCPGLFTLDEAHSSLTVPAGGTKIVALTVSAPLAGLPSRLSWNLADKDLGIALYNADGAAISAAPVLQGKAGAVFTPAAAGTIYATVSNANEVPVKLNAMALLANLGGITVTLGDAGSGKVVFSQAAATIKSGGFVDFSATGAIGGASGWTWSVDGVADSAQTTAAYRFDSTGRSLGSYVVGVSVLSGGVTWSGSTTVHVVSAAEATYTVTYSNENATLGADSGTPPVDVNAYAATASATVLPNSGGLARNDRVLIGWTLDASGGGTVLHAGDLVPINAGNLVLYPKWSDMVMVPVPGGCYQRDATIANISAVDGFLIGRTEVTRAQWVAVMGWDTSAFSSNTQDNPMQSISWYDAVEFCNALSAKEGLVPVYSISGRNPAAGHPVTSAEVNINWAADGYRLPTEMEWRWAFFGASNAVNYNAEFSGDPNSAAGDSANAGNYAVMSPFTTTQPVMSKLPNALGIYDMSGNVWEWCWDQVPASTYTWPAGLLDNYQAAGGGYRPTLGGGFGDPASSMVFNQRPAQAPAFNYQNLGFRVARSAHAHVSYVFDNVAVNTGMYNFYLPANTGLMAVKAWGAGAGRPDDSSGGSGGFTYSESTYLGSQSIYVCVGTGGTIGIRTVLPVPAAGGTGTLSNNSWGGGGGSVVALYDGTLFSLVACAGGGGSAGGGKTGDNGGDNGGTKGDTVYSGGCNDTRTSPDTTGDQGYGGKGNPSPAYDGKKWTFDASSFSGLGGTGASGYVSGGGGYGGGGGGNNWYSAGGGGSYSTGANGYFLPGLSFGGKNSTLDPDYTALTGTPSPGQTGTGGSGRVVIKITF